MAPVADLPRFTSVDLGFGVSAGFTSRFGGVSAGPFESLNLGLGVEDSRDAVIENRRRAAELIGAPVAFATQVHGTRVFRLADDDDADIFSKLAGGLPETIGVGDAIVTANPSVALGVLVADCVPVLLASRDPLAGPGAAEVAVAHAGRQGLASGVVAAIVAELSGAPDSDGRRCRREIVAAIGPAVCARCYEVPAAMRAEVAAVAPEAWAVSRSGTPSLDLPGAVAAQLAQLGVSVEYRSPFCTMEGRRFFSHRRATAQGLATGRQAGLIRLLTPM